MLVEGFNFEKKGEKMEDLEGRKERKRRGRGEGKAGGRLIFPRVNGPISALLRTGRSLLPFDSLFRGGRVCGDQITKKLENTKENRAQPGRAFGPMGLISSAPWRVTTRNAATPTERD